MMRIQVSLCNFLVGKKTRICNMYWMEYIKQGAPQPIQFTQVMEM